MKGIKLAVIGSPIAHSLSPIIHKTALSSITEKCSYDKFEVKKGELDEFLVYARKNLDGFNLTMPHKVDVIPFLDGMSDAAKEFSSVNTVKVKDGKLYGYNTDADGYISALLNKGYDPYCKKIVFIGAGGVAEPIVKRLDEKGASKIIILNRTVEKAEALASCIDGAEAYPFSDIAEQCINADILINATPIGMDGVSAEFEDLHFLEALKPDALVSDLIYSPRMTKLLISAKAMGFRVMNGLDMLIFQAILADEYYLDEKLDLIQVYKKVKEVL